MNPIQTSKPGGMPRFIYALIVCALIATVGVRSGIAADKGPKATVVFDHALPNVETRFHFFLQLIHDSTLAPASRAAMQLTKYARARGRTA